ncbi:NAP1 Nucleosome assembly protein 1 [Candida maltosa Xu316]
MSEPIKKKNGDISKAPTPQNTPSSVTNSYMRSKPPTVSTIEETNEDQQQILANNPALLSMIQGKLGDLIGKQSGVYGLKSLQLSQMKLEAEFQKELLELEKKYFSKYEPLYEKRKKIINGDLEPSAEEIEEGEQLEREEKDEDEEEEEEEEDEEEDDEDDDGEDKKGIPGFWLTALENLSTVQETITDRDSEVLQSLIDIRMKYLSTPGFELIFEFKDNEFFTNKTLTKTYHYQAELGYSGDFVYDHADGCEISWKSKENNVTINIERRKQRNKNTKQTRTIEKLTPTESFFNFFDPPKPPKVKHDEDDEDEVEHGDEDEVDDEEDEELEGRLELDYQLGEEIKDRLIPRAIDWFTGDAVDFGYPEDFDGDEEGEFTDEEGEGEDGDDDDDEDDDEEEQKQQPPECKQQ